MDYSTKTYTNPIRGAKGVKPHERDYDEDE